MTLASRIVVLAGGGIAQVGAPLDLYERPENEFVAQFIGSPKMNLIPGKITGTGERTTVDLEGGGRAVSLYPSSEALMGAAVNVGVRPEDFIEATEADYLFRGQVDITEALGEVTLLYYHAEEGRDPAIAKLQGIHRDMKGRSVAVTADPEKVHVFKDGVSLLHPDGKNVTVQPH